MRSWGYSPKDRCHPGPDNGLSKGDNQYHEPIAYSSPFLQRGFYYIYLYSLITRINTAGTILFFSFAGLVINILLMQYSYIHYMRSLGLDWNPFKMKILGITVRKRESIRNIIDSYLRTREFEPSQKKRLLFYQKWETVSTVLFFVYFIMAILLLIVVRNF